MCASVGDSAGVCGFEREGEIAEFLEIGMQVMWGMVGQGG